MGLKLRWIDVSTIDCGTNKSMAKWRQTPLKETNTVGTLLNEPAPNCPPIIIVFGAQRVGTSPNKGVE